MKELPKKTQVKFWLKGASGGHLAPLTDTDRDFRKGKVYMGDQKSIKYP